MITLIKESERDTMADGYKLRYGESRDDVTCIPNELWDHYLPNIGGIGVLVYTFLYRITSRRSKVDFEYMASELMLHYDDVQKAIAKLIEMELLSFSGSTHTTLKVNDPKDKDKFQRFIKAREENTKTLRQKRQEREEIEEHYKKENLFEIVEKEYGRPLRTAEYRALSLLEEEYPRELIIEAVARSVLNQAFNLQYVQTILHNWKLKGVKTMQDVEREDEKFLANKKGKTKKKPKKNDTQEVPSYYDIYAKRDEKEKK
ncbi:MAG: DnaD domain-containing protein [Clostridia bacterium]